MGNSDNTPAQPGDEQANHHLPVVNLLDDKPSDNDDTGGGHKRVAEAIARLIEREKGGKAIALEGSWGSGKSSVVRMLEQACCKDTVVYTFDAWKHEGDPLRVAFLRGLVDCLWKPSTEPKRRGWLKDGEYKAWRRGIDSLAAGTGKTQTLESLDVQTPDIVALTALLAIPTAIAFAVAYLTATHPDGQLTLLGELAIFFLIFMLLVPIVVKWLNPDAMGRIFEVMVTRQPKKNTVQLHESGEVSSLDFEREFNRLLKDVLDGDGSRRLVIVIDNLDRLSAQDALAVWTSMRVFLEMNAKAAPWLTRFWLMVPYDREALSGLWEDAASAPVVRLRNDLGEPCEARLEVVTSSVSRTGSPRHSRPSSFLDKTFAIPFDVPPLLLANWEKALGEYLDEALPGQATPEAKTAIARLSRRFASERNHPPTPRHLKLFVNNIGALVRQHGTTFPLETLAAYAILRRAPLSPEGIREDLRTERKDIDRLLGANWLDEERATNLACLVFNTHEKELARELLLAEPIGRAIGTGKLQELQDLLANPAAESVLEDSIDEILFSVGRDNAKNVERGFEVLDAILPEIQGRKAEALGAIAERLYPGGNVLRSASNAPILCHRVARLAPNPDTLAQIVQHLAAVAQDNPSTVSSDALAKCWSNLWSQGGEAVQSDPGFRQILLPGDAGLTTHFLMELRHVVGADASLWSRLRAPDGLDLTKAMLPAETGIYWIQEQLDALTVVSYMPQSSLDWKRVADAMHESIRDADEDDNNICADLLRFMRGFDSQLYLFNPMRLAYRGNEDSPFVKHRLSLRREGKMLSLFTTATTAKRWDDAADFLVEHGLSEPITSNTQNILHQLNYSVSKATFFDDPSSNADLLNSIAAIDPHWLKRFLHQQLKEKESILVAASVIAVMTPQALRKCFHPATVIRSWDTLKRADKWASGIIKNIFDVHEVADGEEPYAISRKLVANEKLDQHPDLMRALVEHGIAEPAFYTAVEGQLGTLTSDFWADDIAGNGPWCALLLALRDRRATTLGTNYYTGLERLASKLVQEPDKVQKIDAEAAKKLLSVVGETHELTLAKALRDLATTALKDKRTRLYEVFGEPICQAMLVDPQRSDVPSIVTLAVNGSHGSEPAWLRGFLENERAPGVVAAADDADRKSLLGTIEEKANAEGKDGGPYAVFLNRCRAEGLAPPEEPDAPDDSTPAQPT